MSDLLSPATASLTDWPFSLDRTLGVPLGAQLRVTRAQGAELPQLAPDVIHHAVQLDGRRLLRRGIERGGGQHAHALGRRHQLSHGIDERGRWGGGHRYLAGPLPAARHHEGRERECTCGSRASRHDEIGRAHV